MSYTLVRVKFEDYEKWRVVFDEAASLRKSFGSLGVRVFRIADKPDEAIILGEYQDMERARHLFNFPEFRIVTQRAGLVEPPDVDFLIDSGSLPS
ncbi:MAG TPA: hypothetical protein VJ768_08175 [Anaerolineales bacterium]|nr:hypothetical protein [Anaerolineales bacterium]